MHKVVLAGLTAVSLLAVAGPGRPGTAAESHRPVQYRDGRPTARYRLGAVDHGVVLRHGDGPEQCDILGARDVWVYESGGTYYMHYDTAGPNGWLAARATSKDLIHWEKQGPVLELGTPGENDSASASYGTTYWDGRTWHMSRRTRETKPLIGKVGPVAKGLRAESTPFLPFPQCHGEGQDGGERAMASGCYATKVECTFNLQPLGQS
jgi:hypothetical protein